MFLDANKKNAFATRVGAIARSLGVNTITLYLFPFPHAGAGRDSTILDV